MLWPQILTAVLTLADQVCDCPVSDADSLDMDQAAAWVEIGIADDDSGTAGDATTATHDMGPLSPPRDESGAFDGRIVAQTGDLDLAPLRTRAFGLWDALSSALRADPTVGVSGVRIVEADRVRVFQGRTEDGGFVELRFTVTYEGLY